MSKSTAKIVAECVWALLALAVANYAYQGLAGHDWAAATERTYFQAVALALAGFRFRRRYQSAQS